MKYIVFCAVFAALLRCPLLTTCWPSRRAVNKEAYLVRGASWNALVLQRREARVRKETVARADKPGQRKASALQTCRDTVQ